MVLPPSKWAMEVDTATVSKGIADQGKTSKPQAGGKGGKKGKGAVKGKSPPKGTKRQANEEEDQEGDDRDKPVIAAFDSDGKVSGLWCRCVRDAQTKEVGVHEENN